MDGLVSSIVVRVSGLHKLVLVDAPTQTQVVRHMVLLQHQNLGQSEARSRVRGVGPGVGPGIQSTCYYILE